MCRCEGTNEVAQKRVDVVTEAELELCINRQGRKWFSVCEERLVRADDFIEGHVARVRQRPLCKALAEHSRQQRGERLRWCFQASEFACSAQDAVLFDKLGERRAV